MLKLNLLFCVFAIALFFTSCQKQNEVSPTIPNYTIESLVEAGGLDNLTAQNYAKKLYQLRADGSLTDEEIASVGQRNDLNLELALLVTNKFKETENLWINSISEDDNSNERTEGTYYRWTGGSSKWCWTCFCTKYPVEKLVGFSLYCNAASISTTWKSCSKIDCNVPSSCD
ncbi:hypothetical protein WAF17_02425 [Bernardetia sp. ABR2-2B]|uniref:hypothetical protein n=1 Tax=Bernardetia sp. ABR2-2B TaxID=3127472 RepID=UPI0030D5C712